MTEKKYTVKKINKGDQYIDKGVEYTHEGDGFWAVIADGQVYNGFEGVDAQQAADAEARFCNARDESEAQWEQFETNGQRPYLLTIHEERPNNSIHEFVQIHKDEYNAYAAARRIAGEYESALIIAVDRLNFAQWVNYKAGLS